MFLFDYGQLDANLKSDKQGLWELIKKKREMDRFFDVFFIINKIDMSLEDDDKTGTKTGINGEKAVNKLKSTAVAHGFGEPKVFGISAQLGAFYKMNKKGLLNNGSPEYNFAKKGFKKSIMDFEEISANPESELYRFSGIQTLENSVLDYIKNIIEKKLVNKIKWEIERYVKELENSIRQNISILKHKTDDIDENINAARSFLIKDMPFQRKKYKERLDKRKNEIIENCKSLIDNKGNSILLDSVDTIITQSCYASFLHLEKQFDLNKALKDSENVNKSASSFLIKKSGNIVEIKLKNKSTTENEYLEKLNYFIGQKVAELIQKALNEYKLELKALYENVGRKLNEESAEVINTLNYNFGKKLIKEWDKLEFNKLSGTNMQQLDIKVPASCIEIAEKIREKHEKTGTEDKESTRSVKKVRAWYNPLRYNPFKWKESTYYQKIYKEINKVPVFKKVVEKENLLKLDLNTFQNYVQGQFEVCIKDWKDNDIESIIISMGEIITNYLAIFSDIQSKKESEIRQLIINFESKNSSLKEKEEEFYQINNSLTRILSVN